MKPITLHPRPLAPMRDSLLVFIVFSAMAFLSACGGSGSGGNQDPPSSKLTISTSSLPTGQVGVAYSAFLAATGGVPPFMWSLTNGTLPSGLKLDTSAGAITGTPTQAVASAPLTFQVVDSSAPQQTRSIKLTLTISSSAVSISISPKRAGLAVTQTLSVSATVANDTSPEAISWSATGGTFSSSTSASGASVTYTAPATPGIYTITATQTKDVTESAASTIGVTDLHGVLTYHNDLSRDGANTSEYTLTPDNVNSSSFGKLFSCAADGAIYAQPLWVANVTIQGAMHNVVLAVTMHDTVYLFDADANPCVTYWKMPLIPSGETFANFGDVANTAIYPDIGILGTPVIDSTTNTVYLVTKTKTTSGTIVFHQRLHAISLVDGTERPNSPAEIDSSVTVPGNCEGGSTVAFNALRENQRPGLALVNGAVYVSWASYGDVDPYHGWILGFNASTLSHVSIFNSSPNAAEGLGYCRAGIWMSGGAPAADASGNLYVITGNGIFDGTSAFGDSILKLDTANGLSVTDWFTPLNQLTLDAQDLDLGSGGAAVLVDQTSGPHPHLLIGGGKPGALYLIDRTNMGHFTSGGPDKVVQTLNGLMCFSTPAFWQNTLYFFGFTGAGVAYTFLPASDTFNASVASSTTSTFSFPGSTPSVSSNGSSNGVVWVIDSHSYGTGDNGPASAGPAVLHAFDATNLGTELWNSSQVPADAAGNAVKFTVPTVANGKVYVGTRGNDTTAGPGTVFGEVDVYGLKPN